MSTLSLLQIGLIGLAGALGAVVRYIVGRSLAERTRSAFPLGTLFINVTGAFVIGLLSTLVGRHLISTMLQVILATGFLGGYTTFSTMSWEGVQLARGGSKMASLLYLSGSLFVGLLAVAFGLALGWWL
ncbi:MAG: fluoride efflux transporter CrcB [Chloroflexota bacterium]|nr:fluoride efflux transporter CrcB [Chloroflexota bacterium]